MKKLLNGRDRLVDDLVEGYLACHEHRVAAAANNPRVVLRRDRALDKVALVIGNGSGHEPIALGWVGKGLLDANAVGEIFAAPPPELVADAILAADYGKGVLLLISSHTGDLINGEMGADMARERGALVEVLPMYDDIASAPRERLAERRGAPGTTFIYKVVGGMAETGATLAACEALGRRVRDKTCTLAASLAPGVSPLTGDPMFELDDDKIFVGMGVHGEPGLGLQPMAAADEIVAAMTERVIADLPFVAGDRVLVLVNGMGATTMMELFTVYRRVHEMLLERGITPIRPLVGELVTTQDMAGFSISLCRADDEIIDYWTRPSDAALFHQ